MIDAKILTEMRARKAKYGFKLDGGLYPELFIALGRLMESLENNKFDHWAELAGMHGTEFRLYTDEDDSAEFVRTNFCIKP